MDLFKREGPPPCSRRRPQEIKSLWVDCQKDLLFEVQTGQIGNITGMGDQTLDVAPQTVQCVGVDHGDGVAALVQHILHLAVQLGTLLGVELGGSLGDQVEQGGIRIAEVEEIDENAPESVEQVKKGLQNYIKSIFRQK